MKGFHKLVNFRDLGGFSGADGRLVKEKRILRSGEVFHLPDREKELLTGTYNLRAIFDFRSMEEITQSPDDQMEGVSYHHINILASQEGRSTGLQDLKENIGEGQVDEAMKYVYRRMIVDKGSARGYEQFIKLLLEKEEGASLFHCFAGKDRTGVGAAIILKLLGVSDQDIMQDYLVTNELRKTANAALIEAERANGMDEKGLEELETAMSVKAIYLEEAFKTADDRFGSFNGYLKEQLHLTAGDMKDFRSLYLND